MKEIIFCGESGREGWKSRVEAEVEVPNLEYEDDNKPSNLEQSDNAMVIDDIDLMIISK